MFLSRLTAHASIRPRTGQGETTMCIYIKGMGNVHVTPEKDTRLLADHIAGMEESDFQAWARVIISGLRARADEHGGEKRRKLFSLAQTVREELAALT
jgi:hypothetical protein